MKISYRRISGDDLAKGIEGAGVTPQQFGALYGVSPRRVAKWLDGSLEVPHGVALLVGLIADPLVLERALVITRYMIEETPAAAEPPGDMASSET